MNCINTIGSYSFLAEPFHCDFMGKLLMSHLGNHLLNAADFHAHEGGFGMSVLQPMHKSWVLSRLAIEMTEIPLAYDKFKVETWIESVVRYFSNRNYAIVGSNGKVYGYGRSIWAMIDTDTRQPVDIFSVTGNQKKAYITTEKLCPMEQVSRVKILNTAQRLKTICTAYSDVDMNGHINSVKYIEHILNLWNIDFYAHHTIKRLDIAYVAEAHGGDLLHFDVACRDELVYMVRVVKQIENHEQETEVCRCEIHFVKY